MQFTTLSVTAESHIATVTLNRPDVRNAFNETVIAELTGAFRALGDTPDVRAIVLTGNGPAFCAGADLNWMKKMAGYSDDENRADALTLVEKGQFLHHGTPYCWYPYGWAGPGWYWCGHGTHVGIGWGGAYGWKGWVVPRSHRVVRATPGQRFRRYR